MTITRPDAYTEYAKNNLEAAGYVVVTAKSYCAAQRRLAIARHEAAWCREQMEHTQRWAERDLGAEIRRLRDRVTFLYGAAIAAGATREDLGR